MKIETYSQFEEWVVKELNNIPEAVYPDTENHWVYKELSSDDSFKEWFKSTKEKKDVQTRNDFGHLTDEDLWYGASPAYEARNPITGRWVEIYPITQ